MAKGIGTILRKLRENAKATQAELCEGICSVSEFARIEMDTLMPGYFELDRFFGRLGKSTEYLEYVLPLEIYELYELQYLIQVAICHQEFEKAEELLKEYEVKKQADKPIHRQFIMQERAQLAWRREKEAEVVLGYLDEAIRQTIRRIPFEEKHILLSAEEVKLLVFRMEVDKSVDVKEKIGGLKELLIYTEKYLTDIYERVKVYPYIVLMLEQYCDKEIEYMYLLNVLDTAFELLRDAGKILYMPEIIEKYADLLEQRSLDTEKAVTIRKERESLLWLEEKYNIHLEKYRLFQHINREFELDYEWLKRTRLAMGLSQEELSFGICSVETLSRIENGKRTPNRKKWIQLLERMGRRREQIETVITVEDYEIIELKREFEKKCNRLQKEEAEKLLRELELQLDMSVLKNKIYIHINKVSFECIFYGGENDWRIHELYQILQEKMKENTSIYDYQLTARESNLLTRIALFYYNKKQYKEAIEIHTHVIENYEKQRVLPVFHAREYELQLENIATYLEESQRVKEALEVGEKRIRQLLEIGKGAGLGRSLTTSACAYEQVKNIEMSQEYFEQALCMLHLMKIEKRYQLVKEYVDVRSKE